MVRKPNRHERSQAKPQRPTPAPAKPFRVAAGFVGGFAIALAAFIGLGQSGDAPPSETIDLTSGPTSHYDLLAMTPDKLADVDIALVNLLCAKGLPGTEMIEIPAVLAKLDEWAAKVKFETERHLYRVTDPKYAEHYNHSEARLRAEFIVQVLQEDCGVRYNPDRIYDPNFRDSRHIFLHGMLPGADGGTCASMPVMYVAIGRRLGYPMKLVAAKEHPFCRWDDGKERFNIEGAGNGGVDYPPDEHYRTWPKPLSDADIATGVFLTSKSLEAELANFLHHRGMCLHQNSRLTEARAAFAEAHRLQPRDANTFTALRVVCGAVPRPRYAQNPAAEAWRQGPRPMDPSDPTAQIYQQMRAQSVGTYGQPVQPGVPTQRQPGMPNYSGHPGVPGQPQQPGFQGQHQTGYPHASR